MNYIREGENQKGKRKVLTRGHPCCHWGHCWTMFAGAAGGAWIHAFGLRWQEYAPSWPSGCCQWWYGQQTYCPYPSKRGGAGWHGGYTMFSCMFSCMFVGLQVTWQSAGWAAGDMVFGRQFVGVGRWLLVARRVLGQAGDIAGGDVHTRNWNGRTAPAISCQPVLPSHVLPLMPPSYVLLACWSSWACWWPLLLPQVRLLSLTMWCLHVVGDVALACRSWRGTHVLLGCSQRTWEREASGLLTWGASEVASRREVGTTTREGVVVVVVAKAVTCHCWDTFPDLDEARPLDRQGGI